MVAAKSRPIEPDEASLLLCKGFKACQEANVLISQACACCSRCSNQIMWRVEECPACRGCFTGYAYYHIQAADKAIRDGNIRLFFSCFAEEGTDEQIKEVGQRVTKCLRGAGLSVEWEENPKDTILIKALTTAERRYIHNKLGPDNRKWAKWAREMADQMGPVSEGEIHHDCECMEYTCFCGKVKDLAAAAQFAHGDKPTGETEDSASQWTTCSEDELVELMNHACVCADASCGCISGSPDSPEEAADVYL